ncbi:hypothetical protein A4D02_06600 [Niastella koreensis]|uniref:Uncharacterized protein n=2 Tax=Niastella koreensis TaxID=354356 RepID=G8TH58_NIAKG|nr:hypothetical protein [Niastella koreensis]AEW01668.1 hypothetical protein Niako_5432 [Niastella koreensis GR20-10]OQP48380.1 hypothetical protein A4D02_06600 [Niastella koreensis]
MQKIKLSDIKKGRISFVQLCQEIEARLLKQAYFLTDETLIVHACLSHIDIKKLDPSTEIVAFYAKEVMGNFIKTVTEEESINTFFRAILSLETLPIHNRLKYENEAKEDLQGLDKLLDHYKEQPFIKRFLAEAAKPRDHEERILHEFFLRATSKRNEVIDYILHKVGDIAIERSKIQYAEHGAWKSQSDIMKKMHVKWDFPYREVYVAVNDWKVGIDYEKLDYRKINLIRNKTRMLNSSPPIQHTFSPEIKKEFLKNYKDAKVLPILNEMIQKVQELPILKKRVAIFKELKALYLSKRWYGLYALALPQIEGIFTEMNQIVKPKKYSTGSLTDKVHVIREYSGYADYSFDYYEYYLPKLRNKFAHTGSDEEIKLKSFMVLLDLKHLIIVFEELNSPLIEADGIIKSGATHFSHVGRISHFLELLNELSNSGQLKEIISPAEEFIYGHLIPIIEQPSFFSNLQLDFSEALTRFEDHVDNMSLVYNDKEFKLFSLTKSEFNIRIKELEKLLESDIKILYEEDLKFLFDVHYFVKNFVKVFPNPPGEFKTLLKQFGEVNRTHLDVINNLAARINIEIPDEYLLLTEKLRHRLV